MSGGGMMAAAPTSMGQTGGGLPMAGTAPAPAPTPVAEPTGLQFGTAGIGTGIVEAQPAQAAPQPAQQTMAPFQQQMMMRQQQYNPYQQQQMMQQNPYQQQQFGGLQAALAQLLGRYNQPMQRQQFMPAYQNQALQYRPDLSQAKAALGRTAVTSAEAQAAAAAKAAGLGQGAEADDFAQWQRSQYNAYKAARDNPYSGGGG